MYICIIILGKMWASFGLVFEGDWAGNFILTWQHWWRLQTESDLVKWWRKRGLTNWYNLVNTAFSCVALRLIFVVVSS